MSKNPAIVSNQVKTIRVLCTTNQISFLQHWVLVQVCLKYLATSMPNDADPIQAKIIKAPCNLRAILELATRLWTSPNFWNENENEFKHQNVSFCWETDKGRKITPTYLKNCIIFDVMITQNSTLKWSFSQKYTILVIFQLKCFIFISMR